MLDLSRVPPGVVVPSCPVEWPNGLAPVVDKGDETIS